MEESPREGSPVRCVAWARTAARGRPPPGLDVDHARIQSIRHSKKFSIVGPKSTLSTIRTEHSTVMYLQRPSDPPRGRAARAPFCAVSL